MTDKEFQDEDRATHKAIHACECLAEVWAQAVDLNGIVKNINGDAEATRAMILQAHIEGLFRGRGSLIYAHPDDNPKNKLTD